MDPDKIQIQTCREGQKLLPGVNIDAGLWNFPQENIAGMNVNAQVCACNILHDFCRHMLCH